jgi:P27 family predicted phage terminase small subunit
MSRRIPTAKKKLAGTHRPDRAPRNEPQPDTTQPICPEWIRPNARQAWRQLQPQLEAMGVLTKIDGNALARYCQLWARWREAEAHILEHGSVVKSPAGYAMQNPYVSIANKLISALSRLESDLGMTPAARTKIEVPQAKEEPDALTKLLDQQSQRTRLAQ